MAKGVITHDDDPAILCEAHEVEALIQVRGKRLLDEHVLPRLDGRSGDLVVGLGRCRNSYRVDTVVRPHVIEILSDPGGEPTSGSFGGLLVEIADPPQLIGGMRDHIPHEIRTPIAGSDDGESDGFHVDTRPDLGRNRTLLDLRCDR
jgi:hypothetical protein